jgi:hypothetical protein
LLGEGESRPGKKEQVLDTALLERLYRHPFTRMETARGPVWLPQ